MSRATPAWFTDFGQNPEAPLRLFAFAHAGGGANVFARWGKALPGVHVLAARLPGRESRIAELPFAQMDALMDALIEQVAPRLDRPFVLYGHSLGGLISYELTHRLRERGLRQPERLLIGAYRSPDRKSPHPPLRDLTGSDLIAGMNRYDSMPRAIVDSPELMELLEPMLRADFSLVETYAYRARAPLTVPVVVYYGEQDALITHDHIEAWRDKGNAGVRLHPMPAGHFFHLTHEADLHALIAEELRGLVVGVEA